MDINIYDLNYPFGWADSINPVTGSYEPQRPNPLEHMTEEQKEYEAVKLVNMIDQLQRCAAKNFYDFALEKMFINSKTNTLAFSGKESFSRLELVKTVNRGL